MNCLCSEVCGKMRMKDVEAVGGRKEASRASAKSLGISRNQATPTSLFRMSIRNRNLARGMTTKKRRNCKIKSSCIQFLGQFCTYTLSPPFQVLPKADGSHATYCRSLLFTLHLVIAHVSNPNAVSSSGAASSSSNTMFLMKAVKLKEKRSSKLTLTPPKSIRQKTKESQRWMMIATWYLSFPKQIPKAGSNAPVNKLRSNSTHRPSSSSSLPLGSATSFSPQAALLRPLPPFAS